jgi:hypothetical protein
MYIHRTRLCSIETVLSGVVWQLNMKKKETEELLNWDAHYVGISALRERQRTCITLEEVISLVLKHPSFLSARITIPEVAVFTSMDTSDLVGSMAYLKSSYLSKPWS